MEIVNGGQAVTRRSFIAGTTAATAAIAATAAGTALASESSSAADDTASESGAAAAATDATGNTPDASRPWLGEEPEVGEPVETLTTDVLIVGAGNGGLAAAATAVDLGVDFLLAEKMPIVQDTRHWVGGVNTKFNEEAGVMTDTARLQYDIARYASFKCNQKVQKVWIDESPEMVDWVDEIMTEAGYTCTLDTEMGDEIDPTWPTGNYIPPQQHMWFSSDGSFDNRNEILQQKIESAGNTILFEHELIKLAKDGDRVTGAYFDTADGIKLINANKGVVLATGGYPANPEMMKALSPMAVSCCTAVSYSPADDGTGIKAGLWAGARKDTESAPMVFNRGLVAPGVDCGYDESSKFRGTVAQMNIGSQPFMKVSRDGTRFANESCPYDSICFAASYHEGSVWAQVFDANAADDIMRFATDGCSKGTQQMISSGMSIDDILADQIEAGLFFKADTIEELADDLGFTGDARDAFLAEVDKYNGFYDAQEDTDFNKEAYRLSEIRTAPFYGAWYGGSLLTTCDGLTIDENMQVLDTENHPIEGLYAVGDCSGSFFANNYPEYFIGTACGRTLTEGRHVIRELAGDLD
jgi:fumarate reductase flavoprotein subunit